MKKLSGTIPLEISSFGWKFTLTQLEKFGKATLRHESGKPARTDSNNFLADLIVDNIFSLDEFQANVLNVPGVIETGLFIGYADRILLHNGKITSKSRIDFSRQNELEQAGLSGNFTI